VDQDRDSDEYWLENLKAEAAYARIDLDAELDSFQGWCLEHGVVPTRSRFISWADRSEPPLNLKRKRRKEEPSLDIYQEPPNWRTLLGPSMGQYDRWVLDQPWQAIRCTHGRKIWLAVLDMQAKGVQSSH
jgi:hypothetical protein